MRFYRLGAVASLPVLGIVHNCDPDQDNRTQATGHLAGGLLMHCRGTMPLAAVRIMLWEGLGPVVHGWYHLYG